MKKLKNIVTVYTSSLENLNKKIEKRDICENASNFGVAKNKSTSYVPTSNIIPLTSNSAITLIALIITIIVLLILAGVTLNMVIGENGIINKSYLAKEKTNISNALEEIRMAILEEKVRVNGNEEEFKFNNVWNTLRRNDDSFENLTENNGEYEIKYKGYKFKIDKNKNVSYIEDDTTQSDKTLTSKGQTTIDGITYNDCYYIYTKDQLKELRDRVNNGEVFENTIFYQKADINLDFENWVPIGDKDNSKSFNGTYDGDNHIVEGLNINSSSNYQALFGYIKNSTIKNLVVNGTVQGGPGSAGVVACIEGGTVSNCKNKADVTHTNNSITWNETFTNYIFIGGVCGLVNGETQISGCSNSGTIEGYSIGEDKRIDVAGVIGFVSENSSNTVISKCSNLGEVKISSATNNSLSISAGGVVGNLTAGDIKQCYNTGKVYCAEITGTITNYSFAGGIVSAIGTTNSTNNVEQCWNSGSVEAAFSGGICGVNNTNYIVSNCYNTGTITSNFNCGISSGLCPSAGGICGWNIAGSIGKCYNKGKITNVQGSRTGVSLPYNSIGGIVGANASKVYEVYNKGEIDALQDYSSAGGVTGLNGGTVSTSYNIGNITAKENTITYLGGVVGWESTTSKGVSYIYNIGNLSANSTIKGGVAGYFEGNKTWSNFYWLESVGTTSALGSSQLLNGKCSTMNDLVSNGSLPSEYWSVNSNIQNGNPYLKCFEDEKIWQRDSSGELYLVDNTEKI